MKDVNKYWLKIASDFAVTLERPADTVFLTKEYGAWSIKNV
jgi:hypothetical protein